jgi:hypothetical protein
MASISSVVASGADVDGAATRRRNVPVAAPPATITPDVRPVEVDEKKAQAKKVSYRRKDKQCYCKSCVTDNSSFCTDREILPRSPRRMGIHHCTPCLHSIGLLYEIVQDRPLADSHMG